MKLKRYQLLEKAMRDYPKDCVARFESAPNTDHKSDGIFQILDINHDGTIGIYSGSGLNCFYISHDEDGKFIDQWAEIVKPSILSGKVAIQVNNEREFKLLMEHYESKGWTSYALSTKPSEWYYKRSLNCYKYGEEFFHNDQTEFKARCYKIIPFAEFAAEVGIKVPVKIMVSEDGVRLYEGDQHHVVSYLAKGEWWYNCSQKLRSHHIVVTEPDTNIAFSTKEAAEKWIEEQNKPKEIRLFGEGDECSVIIKADGSMAIEGIKIHKGEIGINFPKEDAQLVYEALKAVQS